jgi:DNA-binding transcriptional ArsR family regulator
MSRSIPSERRQQILDTLRARRTVTVVELARQLGVSEMTIHRDLRELEERGLIQRVFGGATLLREDGKPLRCGVCGSLAERRLDFVVELDSGQQVTACCPHCGLMLLQRIGPRSRAALTFDFLNRQPINARDATYLVGSAVAPCCSPSVLAFLRSDEAGKFQAAFGGDRGDLSFAMEWIAKVMGFRVEHV